MCPAARAFEGQGRGAVRQQRVGHQLGQIGPRAQHHQAELLVRQVLLGRRDRDTDLDVRLDHGDGVR